MDAEHPEPVKRKRRTVKEMEKEMNALKEQLRASGIVGEVSPPAPAEVVEKRPVGRPRKPPLPVEQLEANEYYKRRGAREAAKFKLYKQAVAEAMRESGLIARAAEKKPKEHEEPVVKTLADLDGYEDWDQEAVPPEPSPKLAPVELAPVELAPATPPVFEPLPSAFIPPHKRLPNW